MLKNCGPLSFPFLGRLFVCLCHCSVFGDAADGSPILSSSGVDSAIIFMYRSSSGAFFQQPPSPSHAHVLLRRRQRSMMVRSRQRRELLLLPSNLWARCSWAFCQRVPVRPGNAPPEFYRQAVRVDNL